MHRQITGLLWAAECQPPAFAGKARPRGAKALGLQYERQLAAAFPHGRAGQWFSFVDANGSGYCQPDLLLVLPEGPLVMECKLTWVPEAHSQLTQLYLPVVSMALGKPARGLVVCKHLTPSAPEAEGNWQDALACGKIWHWLGPQQSKAPRRRSKAVSQLLQTW